MELIRLSYLIHGILQGSNKIILCKSTLLINILCNFKLHLNAWLTQIDTPFDLKGFPHAFQSLLLVFLDIGPLGQEGISLFGLER